MDMSRMDMGSMGRMAHGTGGAPHAHTMVGMGGSALGMLAAHLLAAALCGLWLAYGERAVFRLLRAAAARLAAPLRMLLALPVPGARPPVRARRAPRRGPPSPASFSATPSPPGDRPWVPLSPETAGSTGAHPCSTSPALSCGGSP